jgi:hypothetical protein
MSAVFSVSQINSAKGICKFEMAGGNGREKAQKAQNKNARMFLNPSILRFLRVLWPSRRGKYIFGFIPVQAGIARFILVFATFWFT